MMVSVTMSVMDGLTSKLEATTAKPLTFATLIAQHLHPTGRVVESREAPCLRACVLASIPVLAPPFTSVPTNARA